MHSYLLYDFRWQISVSWSGNGSMSIYHQSPPKLHKILPCINLRWWNSQHLELTVLISYALWLDDKLNWSEIQINMTEIQPKVTDEITQEIETLIAKPTESDQEPDLNKLLVHKFCQCCYLCQKPVEPHKCSENHAENCVVRSHYQVPIVCKIVAEPQQNHITILKRRSCDWRIEHINTVVVQYKYNGISGLYGNS